MQRFLVFGLLAVAVASVTRGTPYWVAWEGNDYPENEGWERRHYRPDGPMADRTLSDGVMTLDGRASTEIQDFYQLRQPINPGPGEEFVAQWGLRVAEVTGHPNFLYDPGFSILSDDAWKVSVVFGVDSVKSVLDHGFFTYEGGGFHAWELRSPDMRSYTLAADGVSLGSGSFVDISINSSLVAWGDFTFGGASLSEWDYFRFGVVPEPAPVVSISGFLMVAIGGTRGRSTK